MSARGCPKCEREVPDGAVACPGCGLATDRMDTFAEQPDSGLAVPAEVAAAWQACLQRWDDPAAHDVFLRAAASAEAFAFAGRSYRRAARERGADDVRAAAGVERVRRMAEAAYLTRAAASGDASPTVPKATVADRTAGSRNAVALVMLLVLLLTLGLVSLFLVKKVRSVTPDERPTRTLERR